MSTNIAIIGGGILGTITAYKLASKGLNVSVFEASPNLGCGITASCEGGLLHHTQGFFYPQLQGLISESVAGWNSLYQQFPNAFLTNSFLRVAYNDEDYANVQKLAEHASQTTKVDFVNDAEVHQLEPKIVSHNARGIVVHDERSIDTAMLIRELRGSMEKNDNVTFNFNTNVTSVRSDDDGSTKIIISKDDVRSFDYTVVAGGPHAAANLLGAPAVEDKDLSHGISLFLPGDFGLNHHVLTLNGPNNSGLAYLVSCEGGLKVGATKVGGNIPEDMFIADHVQDVRSSVVALYPEVEHAFKEAVPAVGLRDMRNPVCERFQGGSIIVLGGVGGAGTTVSTGMAERVLSFIR